MSGLLVALGSPGIFYAVFVGLIAAWLGLRAWLRHRIGRARWDARVQGVERLVLTFMIVAMLLLSVLQIILRNLFHSGLVWTEPCLRHLVLWIGFTGGVVATGRLRHIKMDVFGRLLPRTPRLLTLRFTTLVAAIVCTLLARAAYVYLREEAAFGSTGFLGIPTWVLTSVLLGGFALMAARFASRVLETDEVLSGIMAGEEEAIEGPIAESAQNELPPSGEPHDG